MKRTRGPLFLLIALTVSLAAVLRVDFILYIAYVVAGLYLFSRLYTPRALARLRVERRLTPNAFLGEDVPVEIRLINPGRLPLPWLTLEEMTPPQLRAGTELKQVVTVGGRSRQTFHYTVRAMRRGLYRVGPLRIQTGDLFGFSELHGVVPADTISIYPAIDALPRLRLPSRLPFGTLPSRQRLYEDPARPIGVRSFRSGDSLRLVNWKVSARTAQLPGGGLMVRTLEPAISLETLVLLVLDDAAYERRARADQSEWAIQLAASLAAHLIEQRQKVGLATNGYDPVAAGKLAFDEQTGRLMPSDGGGRARKAFVPSQIAPANGRAHLIKILELLARIERHETGALAPLLPRLTLNLAWGTTLLVIAPTADLALLDGLHRLLRAGYNPILLLCAPVAQHANVAARARRLGFLAAEILTAADLARYF